MTFHFCFRPLASLAYRISAPSAVPALATSITWPLRAFTIFQRNPSSGARPAGDTSACPHDSGGPYFREGKDGTATLLAVVSTGPLCPHPGADSAARTDQLAGWISGTMADPPSPVSWWRVVSLGAGALVLVAVVVVALRKNRRRV